MRLYPYAKLFQSKIEDGAGEFASGKPLGITVHYTAGGSAASTINYLRQTNLDYHLVIDRNGEVYQMVYLDRKVNHAGNSSWYGLSLNKNHIAIAIANWGRLDKSQGQYLTWALKSLPPDKVVSRPYNSRKGTAVWEAAPLVQEKSLMECLYWLTDNLEINTDHICGHDEADGKKVDPGGSLRNQMSQIRHIVCTIS